VGSSGCPPLALAHWSPPRLTHLSPLDCSGWCALTKERFRPRYPLFLGLRAVADFTRLARITPPRPCAYMVHCAALGSHSSASSNVRRCTRAGSIPCHRRDVNRLAPASLSQLLNEHTVARPTTATLCQ